MPRRTKLSASLLLAFGGAMVAGGVAAQDAQRLERVEITGSAIKRIDAETSVPVTVLSIEDLRSQGVASVEDILSNIASSQANAGTTQIVGSGTGGASFADLRGIGASKTLILLNGRRIANNALDSSAPDLNMIPFAAIQRVEVLRDGASALYGTDAIAGVINFITRKDFSGGTLSIGIDDPELAGGSSRNVNLGFGFGNLDEDRFNVFAFFDAQNKDSIEGLQRPFFYRQPGGLSPTPFPGNYFQDLLTSNPLAPNCDAPNLLPNGQGACQISTSAYVNYTPKVERRSMMLGAAFKISNNHTASAEYFRSASDVSSVIAPTPYGALYQNPTRPDGSPNPFFPGNAGSSVPTPLIPIDPAYLPAFPRPGQLAGGVNVRWRDLVNGSRQDISENEQQRAVLALEGFVGGWDYQTAFTYNENKYTGKLDGYSDGALITAGVLNGIINPFGDQTAEGLAYIEAAGLSGTLQTAKGTVYSIDAKGSRELGDWLGAGRPAAIAIGAEFRREEFKQQANFDFATAVINSTGFDPNTLNEGDRNINAFYVELNLPVTKTLELTGSLRRDDYSDFGTTTNPKVGFRFQPNPTVLVRGSYSTGFRAPSLYEINAAQTFTNTSEQDDPVNCPGGVPIPGKSALLNCDQQFQTLAGGNLNLEPEESKSATLGIVFEPTASTLVGFDFWWVKLTNQIGSLSDNTVFGPNFQQFQNLFIRTPTNDLATDGSQCQQPIDPNICGYVDLRTNNLGDLITSGIDITGRYRFRMDDGAGVTLGLQSTWVNKYDYQDYKDSPWNQNVGVYSGAGPIFRWQHNLTAAWNKGNVGLGLAVHHKSSYTDETPDNTVASYTTADVYGTWAPAKGLSLLLGIRNFTDRDPPFSNQSATFQANYDPRFTDPTGRTYYARLNYLFD